MTTIGVIGHGFVGEAVAKGFCHAFDVNVYDKEQGRLYYDLGHSDCREVLGVEPNEDHGGSGVRTLVRGTDGPIFVCVPTPMHPDGRCDISIVEDVVAAIAQVLVHDITSASVKDPRYHERVTVLKSTVPPGTTSWFATKYQIPICFNPEFLTEANYLEDFKSQGRIVLGGTPEATRPVRDLYRTAFPDVPVFETGSREAEMVKYLTNCFLATKVSLANDFRRLCAALGIDYDKVIGLACLDKRIGNSHWQVPGPDGKHGFGGSCFPKDVCALLMAARDASVEMSTLLGAWATNLRIRPERDWEELKGRAVVDRTPRTSTPES